MEPQKTLKDAEFLYQQESYVIRGACFEVYKEMGPGFLEAVYQECLAKEFARQDIPFIAQQQLSLQYKGELLMQSYVPDFICYNKIIIEIKGTREIAPEHKAQLLNYLKAISLHTSFCSLINQWVTDVVAMLTCRSGFHMNQWVADACHGQRGAGKRCV